MRRIQNDRFAVAGLLAAMVAWLIAIECRAQSAEALPAWQVTPRRDSALMLDYFKNAAASLPAGERIPADRQEWERRRGELREQLWRAIGGIPLEDRPPLRPRITGCIDHGDHVVQKLIYESLPGLYVTALVYVPKNIQGRAPAVLYLNGHWNGAKAEPLIQRCCLGLARMGVIVFCQDVIGTGERSAHSQAAHPGYHGNYRGAAPWVVGRSLLGYVLYEGIRAIDYLESRPDVDPTRILSTGSSGGGMQCVFLPALDDRLCGSTPVCWVSDYHAHLGATACVCEIPLGALRGTNQWEILGLHAPRPLLCIGASRDTEVFQSRHMHKTLSWTTDRVYRLYHAESNVRAEVVNSGHDYNRPMRELLYAHVAKHLLGRDNAKIVEPDDLPLEPAAALQCGLPPHSATLQSLTHCRAKELIDAITPPDDMDAWRARKREMLASLRDDVLGGFPDMAEMKQTHVRDINWNGHRLEHWILEVESGLPLPAVLCLPKNAPALKKPAVLVIDEDGKRNAFQRGLVPRLADAGFVVLALDMRGTGETAGTTPEYEGSHDYNLSNYSLLIGRPLVGMRIHDARRATDFLAARHEVDRARIVLVGRGIGGLVAILAAAYDARIHAVVAEETLSTWAFQEEYANIGLSYLIPRILTVADRGHLAACVAPRPLWLINPVDGRRRPVALASMEKDGRFTNTIYAMHHSAQRLKLSRIDDHGAISDRLVEWLVENDNQP